MIKNKKVLIKYNDKLAINEVIALQNIRTPGIYNFFNPGIFKKFSINKNKLYIIKYKGFRVNNCNISLWVGDNKRREYEYDKIILTKENKVNYLYYFNKNYLILYIGLLFRNKFKKNDNFYMEYIELIEYNDFLNNQLIFSQSWINMIKKRNSLLYPHVYPLRLYNNLKKQQFKLIKYTTSINDYNNLLIEDVYKLKESIFPKDSFVVILSGKMSMNTYPSSLLHAIKRNRENNQNIYLLILSKLEIGVNNLF